MKDQLPSHLDWMTWVERFDRMQDRYLAARRERFEVIVRAIAAARPAPMRALDLGCGTGSLSEPILEAFPGCQLVGIDLDETLLMLAAKRLDRFGARVRLLQEDLRQDGWMEASGGGFDAVVSATALHWLSAEHLAELYRRLAAIMKPGGVFLNADHVANECQAIQAAWQQRKKSHAGQDHGGADTWPEFWQAYAAALNRDASRIGSKVIDVWEAVEEGMPLTWHFDRLREAGFCCVECFWRCDGDAVYGAVLRLPGGSPAPPGEREMTQYRIDFESIAWQAPAAGVRFRAFQQDGKRLRLVEFTRQFVEADWCRKGHIGLILEGQMEIDFGGRVIAFGPGDGLFIPPGERHRHKARVLSERVRAVMVEEAAPGEPPRRPT